MEEFGPQVMQHLPRLRRYARALTGERAAADDLVQDTLERAWTKLRLWRPGSDMRAWLFTVMHNVYVNQVRSRASQPPMAHEDEALNRPDRARQSDMLEVRDLDVVLKELPEEQREVLLLVALEQLTYEETAKVLGIPIGTVMSRLSRARERLRRIMAVMPEVAGLRVIK